ncbi:MAG TPA: tryptophan synthase subunit alpha, partial [Gaiellaceae bacterium]|nr:tryptophan synthase subunit alpha [Gaiellaceae bacterium]
GYVSYDYAAKLEPTVQLGELRAAGADVVLLLLKDLDDRALDELMRAARELELDALVEAHDADERAAGADSLIVADLPAGGMPELRRVQLVAPTSTDDRLRLAAEQTDGWLYVVTLTGTTGARDRLSPALAGLAARARALTELPLYAGFGISTPEQAAQAAELADGVVVGSRAVEVAEQGPAALHDYVSSLRAAIGERADTLAQSQ